MGTFQTEALGSHLHIQYGVYRRENLNSAIEGS